MRAAGRARSRLVGRVRAAGAEDRGAGVAGACHGAQLAVFYGVSMLAKPLAALLLAREMFGAAQARIGFQVGEIVPPSRLTRSGDSRRSRSPGRCAAMCIGCRSGGRRVPDGRRDRASGIAARGAPRAGAGRETRLQPRRQADPAARRAGRLRGAARDRPSARTRVPPGRRRHRRAPRPRSLRRALPASGALGRAGAGDRRRYRLGEAGAILRERGHGRALFAPACSTMRRPRRRFWTRRSSSDAASCSPAYWGSRSLDYLWQGIGAICARDPTALPVRSGEPECALPREAREWIAHCHQHYFGDARALARARNPFVVSPRWSSARRRRWSGRTPAEGLAQPAQRLDALGVSLPMLYRQYVGPVRAGGRALPGFRRRSGVRRLRRRAGAARSRPPARRPSGRATVARGARGESAANNVGGGRVTNPSSNAVKL